MKEGTNEKSQLRHTREVSIHLQQINANKSPVWISFKETCKNCFAFCLWKGFVTSLGTD